MDKVRTRSKSLDRVVEAVRSYRPLEEVAVLHVDAPEAAQQLAERLSPYLPGYRLTIAEAGITVGSHGGPGAVGAACVLAPQEF